MYFGTINIVLLNESVVSFNVDEKNVFEKNVFENVLFSDFIMIMPQCGMFFYIHTNKYIIR